MRKRIIAILLSAAMIVGYMPSLAFADLNYWTFSGSGSVITGEYHEVGQTYHYERIELYAPDMAYTGNAYDKAYLKTTNDEWLKENGKDVTVDDIKYYNGGGTLISRTQVVEPGDYTAELKVGDGLAKVQFKITSPDKYKVTFDTNGGSQMDSVTVNNGAKVARPSAEPTKANCVFEGWYTDEACTDAYDFNTPVTADIKIYAKWSQADYIVTLHGNGHVIGTESRTTLDKGVKNGQSCADAWGRDYNADAEKNWYENHNVGYEFKGWYADEDLTERYNFNNPVTANLDLYAKFVAKDVTVSFDTKGGNKVSSIDVAYNGKLAEASVPTPVKANYEFAGWFTDADCTNAYDFNTAVTKNITLYADWSREKYTVTLHGNGFVIADNGSDYLAKKVDAGASFADTYRDYNAKSEEVFYENMNPGYEFLGWYADEDLTIRYNFNDAVNENIDLYAKFAAQTVTVSFDSMGGNKISSIDVLYNEKLAEDSVPEPSRENYVFKGWYTDEACTDAYDFNTVLTADITLYAKWARADYKVTLHGGKFIIALNDAYQLVSYRVKTIEDGASFADTYRDYNADAEKAWYEAQNPGYEFKGWYTDKECTESYDFHAPIYGNLNLYAKFESKQYLIKYNADNMLSKEKMADVKTTFDDEAYLSENLFTRDGYKFMGWSTKKNSEHAMIEDYATAKYSIKMIADLDDTDDVTYDSKVVTLYAVWAPIKYLVTYDANGANVSNYYNDGKNTTQVIHYNDTTKPVDEMYNTLWDVQFEKLGYHFTGWNTEADGSGIAFEDKQVLGVDYIQGYVIKNTNMTDVDGTKITLYAQWEANKFPIIFNSNYGENATVQQEMTYDKEEALKGLTFNRAGYYFKGWSTEKDGPVVFENGQKVKNLCTGDWCVLGCEHPETKGLKLYAQWQAYDQTLVATAYSSGRTATVTWQGVTGATSYDVYGAKCGKNTVYLGSTKGTSMSFNKIGKKKLAKRGKYKFYVVAHVGNKTVQSVLVHTITNNFTGKYGNVTSVKTNVSKVTLDAGASQRIYASQKTYKNKKWLGTKHGAQFRYISSDTSVARVDAYGVITAVKSGTCYVYVQGINGVYTKIQVVVKGTYKMKPDSISTL